jgi:hypothetical protein
MVAGAPKTVHSSERSSVARLDRIERACSRRRVRSQSPFGLPPSSWGAHRHPSRVRRERRPLRWPDLHRQRTSPTVGSPQSSQAKRGAPQQAFVATRATVSASSGASARRGDCTAARSAPPALHQVHRLAPRRASPPLVRTLRRQCVLLLTFETASHSVDGASTAVLTKAPSWAPPRRHRPPLDRRSFPSAARPTAPRPTHCICAESRALAELG